MASQGEGFIPPRRPPGPRSGPVGDWQNTNYGWKFAPWTFGFLLISAQTSFKNWDLWSAKRGVLWKRPYTKNSVFARSIPQKLQSQNSFFYLFDFLQNIENWTLACTRAQFWLFWKLTWSHLWHPKNQKNCSFTCTTAQFLRCSYV